MIYEYDILQSFHREYLLALRTKKTREKAKNFLEAPKICKKTKYYRLLCSISTITISRISRFSTSGKSTLLKPQDCLRTIFQALGFIFIVNILIIMMAMFWTDRQRARR